MSMLGGRAFSDIARTRDAPTRTNGRLLLVAGAGVFPSTGFRA